MRDAGTGSWSVLYIYKDDATTEGNSMFRRLGIAHWAPIPLRCMLGLGFVLHGWAKLSRGPAAFAGVLHALGVPYPHVMAWATIAIELAGGFAVLLGAFINLVSIPMIAVMLVAVFTVHLPYGFSSIKLVAVTSAGPQFGKPGYETAMLYIACLVALILGGSGPLAIDGLLERRKARALSRFHRGDSNEAGKNTSVSGGRPRLRVLRRMVAGSQATSLGVGMQHRPRALFAKLG